MNHSTSKRTARKAVAPQVEATVAISGITAKIVKCTAKKAFTVGNASIKEGETFFLVKSERRAGRYYVVHFSEARATYQCSCGANCCEHEHVRTVREHVMNTVVVPASESSAPAPMTVPATAQEVKDTIQASKKIEEPDGSRPLTAAEWKEIHKRDKARQRAWATEYRQQAETLKQTALAG